MSVVNKAAFEWRSKNRDSVMKELQVYLKRVGRRGSENSVKNAANELTIFCSYLEMLPKDAVEYVSKKGPYKVLDDYIEWMVDDCKLAPNSIKDYLSGIVKFLRFKDLEISNEKMRSKLDLPRIYTLTQDKAPSIDELRRILTNTNGRGKSLITLLASSGMRVGEALSLRVKDLDFTKSLTTIRLRAEVTKAKTARYCFLSNEATTFLREFLGGRIDDPSAYLFLTSSRGVEHDVGNFPMSYWNARAIFSTALAAAGLDEKDDYGRAVLHLHCLRKFFFSQLLPTLGREVVEALMGHTKFLDSAYRRFTEDQMQDFYTKGIDQVTIMLKDEKKVNVREELVRELLKISGFKTDEVESMELSSLESADIQQMVREKLLGAMTNNGNKQKVIPVEQVKVALGEGWEYVDQLPNNEAIVKLP